MEELQQFDSISSELLDLNIEADAKQLEYQRALEVLYQTLSVQVQSALLSLPSLNDSSLISSIEETQKFLSAHHTYSDPEMIQYLGSGLIKSFQEFHWKEFLKQNLQKQWSALVSDLSSQKASSYFSRIDELISLTYLSLQRLLQNLHDLFQTTPIKYNIFPQVTLFDSFFNEKNQELRQKTKKLKLQLKFCPGVEPPTIKRVQYETFTMVKKNFTEWNTFSEEEMIEVEKAPACTMVPLVHRLFSMFTDRYLAVASYYAPVGWEVTRVNAFVVDGFFKECNIKRSVCRENKALVEVEVIYPRVVRENIWCRVRLEGVVSRKRILDVRVPHIKDVLVVVDENGEHELPDGVIDFDDIEI